MKAAVLTDSTCDLPLAQAQPLRIEVIPLVIHMRSMAFFDWEDVEPDDVYQQMRVGHSVSTSPVSQERFEQQYQELLRDHDVVVSLHLSGKLSETVRHARAAAQRLNVTDRVHVIDTGLVGYPMTDVAMLARRILDEGGTVGEVEKGVTQFKQDMLGELTVPTLDYLRRSGRVSRVQHAVGHLLSLRPVIRFEAGSLVVNRTVRAERAAEDILEQMRDRYGKAPLSMVVANAGRNPRRFAELRQVVDRSGLNVVRGRIQIMGPVVGAHVGPDSYSFMASPL